MIRLFTLGTIALEDDSGTELARVLRQPKRFGLLAYLALARPRGLQRRDTLLGLFWPELDTERARAALRQALYTLRRSLPEGVLETRGDEEVGIAAGRLWSDAHEFEKALREGRPAEALELYRGDLLEGFHVPGASPELDYWLAAERERLRTRALQAAREAGAAAERAGELAVALSVAQRASTLAPLDEAVARRRVELLHRTGDTAAALRVYERWSARLREELEIEPSQEMRAFVETLRRPQDAPAGRKASRGPRRGAAPASSPVVGQGAGVGPAPEASTGPDPSTDPSDPRPDPEDVGVAVGDPVSVGGASRAGGGARAGGAVWAGRAVTRWAVAALILLVVAAAFAVLPLRSWWPGASEPAMAPRVIVLPFAYRGGAESAYLSEGLVYLFSVALDGGGLRSVDPHTLVRRAAEYRMGEYDPESAAGLAARLGAEYFVLGDVVEREAGLQMTGRLYEREGDRVVPRGASTASGPIADLPRLVDQVAGDILSQHPGSSLSRMSRVAAMTTPSLTALKAYLRGERLLREARFGDAITAFEEAVAADTLFALAHYRMSLAASWAFRGELASSAAARAVRHADRLPERHRRLLLAHAAYRRGEATESAAMLRGLAEDYPEDPEVWYRLGEVLMHFGPGNGWPITDAAAPFRRAAELEPLLTEVQYHLAQIEASAGRPASALAWIRGALELAPDGARAPQLRVLRTAMEPGGQGWSDRLRELEGADDFTVISATYNAAVFARQPERGLEVATLLTRGFRPVGTRVFGHLLMAELELALGRGERAWRQVDRIRQIDPGAADPIEALLSEAPAATSRAAASPGAAASADQLRALAARLHESAERGGSLFRSSAWLPEDRSPAAAYLYAAGRLSARLGDMEGLDRAARSLRSLPRDTLLAASLASDLDLLRDPTNDPDAVTVWRPASLQVPAEVAVLSPVYSRPARRFQYARALEREGRLREALVWYEGLEMLSVHDLPWAVPALADRARVHEALGDSATAADLRRRFHGLWAGAPPAAPER